jgi:hypothetical protein
VAGGVVEDFEFLEVAFGLSSLTAEEAGLWEKAGVGVPMLVVLLFSGASAWKRRALCWRACRYHR